MLIAVLAIGGVGLWFLLADAGEPTARFDGETATYSGSTSFEAGEITFTLDATGYDNQVAFLVTEVIDSDMTMADFEAYAAANPANSVPSWAGRYHMTFVDANEVADHQFALTEGTWLVSANTSPGTTNRVHPATLIEVGK